MWEHAPLELKYEITLSTDEKNLTKKITMGKNTRLKITVDKARMMYVTNRDNLASISSEMVREIPIYFDLIKPAQVKDLRNIDSLDKEKTRTNYNKKAISNLFYSTTTKTTRTVTMAHGNLQVF